MSAIFYGALITPTTLTEYRALPRALLSVSRTTGDIEWIEDDVAAGEVQDVIARRGAASESVDIVRLKLGEFLIPGFVDTHIVSYCPQKRRVGAGLSRSRSDCPQYSTRRKSRTLEGVSSRRCLSHDGALNSPKAARSMSYWTGSPRSHFQWSPASRTPTSRSGRTLLSSGGRWTTGCALPCCSEMPFKLTRGNKVYNVLLLCYSPCRSDHDIGRRDTWLRYASLRFLTRFLLTALWCQQASAHLSG